MIAPDADREARTVQLRPPHPPATVEPSAQGRAAIAPGWCDWVGAGVGRKAQLIDGSQHGSALGVRAPQLLGFFLDLLGIALDLICLVLDQLGFSIEGTWKNQQDT